MAASSGRQQSRQISRGVIRRTPRICMYTHYHIHLLALPPTEAPQGGAVSDRSRNPVYPHSLGFSPATASSRSQTPSSRRRRWDTHIPSRCAKLRKDRSVPGARAAARINGAQSYVAGSGLVGQRAPSLALRQMHRAPADITRNARGS